MAMIKCPNCNEDISDKAMKCVHCGYILKKETGIFCEECGAELKENEKVCSNCGCPVVNTDKSNNYVRKSKLKKGISKKKIIVGIILTLVIIGVVVAIIFISKYNAEQKEKELSEQYKENLSTITYMMLNGAAEAESCGNLIKSVWSNTIWEEDDPETDKYTKKNGVFNDDFNDSFTTLFSDSEFIEKTDSVEQNQDDVNKIMKDMKNPPEEWKEAYSDLKDFYEDYLTLINLCINPSGSLQTYSTNFSNADADTVTGYNKMESYLD